MEMRIILSPPGIKVDKKRPLVNPSVEQPSPKRVKTGQGGNGPHTEPIKISSSLPEESEVMILLNKLNASKTHHIVSA